MTLAVALLLALLVLGVPIAAAFGLAVFLNLDASGARFASLANLPYDAVSSFALAAIPLFILVGEVMNRGGLAGAVSSALDRALRFSRAPFGHVMITASAFMGAITGSSVATVAAIGAVVGPEMRRRGYPPGYTAALNAAAGLLGTMIPPSIPLILYGATVGVSITQLFLATLVPGLLMTAAFATVHLVRSRRLLPTGREEPGRAEAPRRSRGGWRLAATSLLPVIVLGGIYGGVFTPTEAASVACLYAIGVAVLAYRMRLTELHRAMRAAAIASAAILFIIAMTSLLNRAFLLNQIPQDLSVFVTGAFDGRIGFLLAVNALLILVGMFMETNAAVLLLGPLLAPSASAFGVDPVHFGIILVTNIELGLLTPPLAANIYVAARTNDVSIWSMAPHLPWFLGAALLVLATITFVPELSLFYRAL
jgi:tripartite ATP-independent transporter DctM subunit